MVFALVEHVAISRRRIMKVVVLDFDDSHQMPPVLVDKIFFWLLDRQDLAEHRGRQFLESDLIVFNHDYKREGK